MGSGCNRNEKSGVTYFGFENMERVMRHEMLFKSKGLSMGRTRPGLVHSTMRASGQCLIPCSFTLTVSREHEFRTGRVTLKNSN